MTSTKYISLTQEQIDKVGNALIFLSNEITELYKTKALKLIYLLDEVSIQQRGIPFFNLKYKVWQYGPVSEELFIDLSSDQLGIFDEFLDFKFSDFGRVFTAKTTFCDDEFSDNDIEILKQVCKTFGNKSSEELVDYTHRKNTPWHNSATKYNVLELLSTKGMNNTEYVVDLSGLVAHDKRKSSLFESYQELH